MNAHQRRVVNRAARRHLDASRARVGLPTSAEVKAKRQETYYDQFPDPSDVQQMKDEPPVIRNPPSAPIPGDADFRPLRFVDGGSVRNKRTGSIATMLSDHGDSVGVKRRDNRQVLWPKSECENWNF